MTNDLSLQHFRPARHAWKRYIRAWIWLLLFFGGAVLLWVLDFHAFAFSLGFIVLVNSISVLMRNIALAQNKIIFYPSHFTMIQGKRRNDTPYSEVEAIDRVQRTPNEEIFVITAHSEQYWFSAEYYEKEALWATFQRYLPSVVFEPKATEKSTLVQQHLQDVEAKLPLVVQQIGRFETILGWGLILFGVWIAYIFWERFVIGSAVFIGVALWFVLKILEQGKIEVDQRKIAHTTLFGRNEVQWDEIEYMSKQRGYLYFGNATKRFVLPLPASPYKANTQRVLWDYLEWQVNTRNIEERDVKTWEWWSKNTHVSTSSK